jgi:cyclase
MEAEKNLWFHLKQNVEGFTFRRQHPIGFNISDFYCHKARLIIELDGNVHDNAVVKINDEIRQRSIEESGMKVFWFKK